MYYFGKRRHSKISRNRAYYTYSVGLFPAADRNFKLKTLAPASAPGTTDTDSLSLYQSPALALAEYRSVIPP
eukprot:2762938-Rhodomonas_salina.1